MHMYTLRQAHLRRWLIGSPVPEALLAEPEGQHDASRKQSCPWVFPQERRWRNKAAGQQGWRQVDESISQKAVRRAVIESGLVKRAKCHSFRHSFATHLWEAGYDIRTVQERLRHRDVKPTMFDTHALQRGDWGVKSPADDL